MLVMRAIYLAGIVSFAVMGRWNAVLFNGVVFLGSLIIPYLGQKDERYRWLDVLVVLTFSLSLLPTYLDAWYTPQSDLAKLFTIDKLYHMVGGACLGIFGMITFSKKVDEKLLFLIVVMFALSVGAAWEVFEWILSILPAPLHSTSSGYADSMIDLVADTIGATIVAIVMMYRR